MSISIPGADYTPQLTGYTGQGAFRFWCQKVLPIVYDDSLSYYELLNKVVVYLNNVIADVASVENNIGELNKSYGLLQEYVNEHMQEIVSVVNEYTEFTENYFNNLDVQEEINTKLDGMATDGSLSRLLGPIVAITAPDVITQWLNDHVTPTTPIVDNTLTISGAAADAKVTGDAITALTGTYHVSTATIDQWEQGTLNATTGAEINSTTRCRSFWLSFSGLDKIVLTVANGYKLSIREYTNKYRYISSPFSGWKTEAILYPISNRLYRFVVSNTDDSDCVVGDLPDNLLVCEGYSPESIYALENRQNLMEQTLFPATVPVEARPKIGTDGFLFKTNGTLYPTEHGVGVVTTEAKRPSLSFRAGYLDDARGGLDIGVDYVFSCKLRWKLLDPSQPSSQRLFTIYLIEVGTGETLPPASEINLSMASQFITYPITKGVVTEEDVSFAFSLGETTTKFGLYFLCNRVGTEFSAGDFIEVDNLMLQKGIRPTPWQPSLGDILNNTKVVNEDLVCKLQQLNRKTRISSSNMGPAPLVLLHFSDIHADEARLGNVLTFKRDYSQYIRDIIHTGDSVKSYASDGMGFWTDTDGAESILNCIGNHDTRTTDSWSGVSMANAYNMVMQPYINNWGVISEAGKTYYYKDYATPGVRLIVLDIMHQTQNQLTWFRNTLSDARTNGLHVIAACHSYAHWLLDFQDTPWDDHPIISARAQYVDPEDTSGTDYPRNMSNDYAVAVDEHIDAGGYFICWLHGHTHFKVFAPLVTHPRQLDVAVSNAGFTYANTYIWERRANSKSENDFNVLAIDTYSHILRIVKIGVDYDVFLRHTDTISWNYDKAKILYTN